MSFYAAEIHCCGQINISLAQLQPENAYLHIYDGSRGDFTGGN